MSEPTGTTTHHLVPTKKEWRRDPGLFDFDDPKSRASVARDEECWLLVTGDGSAENPGVVNLCYKHARKLAKSQQDVDDMVQEALLHAYNAARRYMKTKKTRYSTFAYSWVQHAVKNYWDAHHRRGLKGEIPNDAVPTLFTASDPEGGDDLFGRVADAEEDQLDLAAAGSWWEDLPAEPAWVREIARLKWQEGLDDREIRKKLGIAKKKVYEERVKEVTSLVAEMLGVDERGKRPEDERGKHKGDDEAKWAWRLSCLPPDREDLREIARQFHREGMSVREIAEDWYTTSAEIVEMIREVKGEWESSKARPKLKAEAGSREGGGAPEGDAGEREEPGGVREVLEHGVRDIQRRV